MSTDELTRPGDDPFAVRIAPGVRSVVEVAPALTVDEIRARPVAADHPGPRPSVAWRLVAAAVLVLVLVGGGLTWRHRSAPQPVASELLPVLPTPTGPVPAENTAASTGESSRTSAADWDVVRTGADDRQLVVFFGGGGCGDYRADVIETPDAVSIAIFETAPPDGISCPAIRTSQAIGVGLARPVGNRRLEGSRSVDGSGRTEPLVVDGRELATLTWPPGAERAASEDLRSEIDVGDFVWTQRFHDVADPEDLRQPIKLEQWRGPTPIDAAAFAQACLAVQGFTTTAVEVGGAPATLVRCPDNSLAVVWEAGADRFTLHAQDQTTGIDETTIVDLAATVRFVG